MEIIMSQWQTKELNFGAETTPSNAKQHDGAKGGVSSVKRAIGLDILCSSGMFSGTYHGIVSQEPW